MTAATITIECHTLDDSAGLPDNYVNAYYLKDLKRRVAARVGGKLFAFDDLYEGCPLSSGLLTGTVLMSQCDGSQFDVTSGAALRGPAKTPFKLYEVRTKTRFQPHGRNPIRGLRGNGPGPAVPSGGESVEQRHRGSGYRGTMHPLDVASP
jgi:nitrite reductase/ring-hydroxylating ferredoxin subunit